jgi:hypothetical protein
MSLERQKIAALIRAFANGTCAEWDWDDFISVRQQDPVLEQVRQQLLAIPDTFPPCHADAWCNDQGSHSLLMIAEALETP